MKCLQCGKRIPLLHVFSDGEFCSAAHRDQFRQQQNDLALARLLETKQRIERQPAPKARPAAKPKGRQAEVEPVFPMAGLLIETIAPVGKRCIACPELEWQPAAAERAVPSEAAPLMFRGFPQAEAVGLPDTAAADSRRQSRRRPAPRLHVQFRIRVPQWANDGPKCEWQPIGDLMTVGLPDALAGGRLAVQVSQAGCEVLALEPMQPRTRLATIAPRCYSRPVEGDPPWVGTPCWPGQGLASLCAAVGSFGAGMPAAAPVWSRVELPCCPAPKERGCAPAALAAAAGVAVRSGRPVAGLRQVAALDTTSFDPDTQSGLPVLTEAGPRVFGLHVAQRLEQIEGRLVVGLSDLPAPPPAEPAAAGGSEPGLPELIWFGPEPQALRSDEALLPVETLLAAGAPAHLPGTYAEAEALGAGEIMLPSVLLSPVEPDTTAQTDAAAAVEPDEAPAPMFGLLPGSLIRPLDSPLAVERRALPETASLWEDEATAGPQLPQLRLTIDQADGSGPRRTAQQEQQKRRTEFRLAPHMRKLPGYRFWEHAPADLKWVAVGLPLLLVLVMVSFRGRVHSVSSQPRDGQTAIGSELNTLQRVILRRAAIRLYDDFRGGLGAWQGADGWAKTWRYGVAGFLEPGQLALYTPSLELRDYSLQFLGQIEGHSLNWVFRAKDERNYYAMAIVVKRGGPMPSAEIVRSVVVGGVEREVKRLPIPFPVHLDTMYLVRMEVKGNTFTTYIQGQVVDNFVDDRLVEGGVGFFGPKGDTSLLRWVELTHQYDHLGRLCALLVPGGPDTQARAAE